MTPAKGITKRDRLIIQCLNSYGFLSTRQLLPRVFKSIRYSTAMHRLRQLEAAHLIRQDGSIERGEYLWRATAKGGFRTRTDVVPIIINRNQLMHDLAVNDVRLAFEYSGLTQNWQPMRLLAAQLQRKRFLEKHEEQEERLNAPVPDGLFILPTLHGPRITALEVELVRKGKRRYNWLFSRYENKGDAQLILYVVPSISFGNFIAEQVRSSQFLGNTARRCIWGLIDEVVKDPWTATLRDLQGRTFRLADMCDLSMRREPPPRLVNSPPKPRIPNPTPHSFPHPVMGLTEEEIDRACL